MELDAKRAIEQGTRVDLSIGYTLTGMLAQVGRPGLVRDLAARLGATVKLDDGRIAIEREMGYVADVFDEQRLSRLPGRTAIGHVRYSTAGASLLINAQPIVFATGRGPLGPVLGLFTGGTLFEELGFRGVWRRPEHAGKRVDAALAQLLDDVLVEAFDRQQFADADGAAYAARLRHHFAHEAADASNGAGETISTSMSPSRIGSKARMRSSPTAWCARRSRGSRCPS